MSPVNAKSAIPEAWVARAEQAEDEWESQPYDEQIATPDEWRRFRLRAVLEAVNDLMPRYERVGWWDKTSNTFSGAPAPWRRPVFVEVIEP